MTETIGGDACRCGRVALVGHPNAGKSTLLNRLVGAKLSITSRKPQTTRHRLLGVRTDAHVQYIFVDTPGFSEKSARRIDRAMAQSLRTAVSDVDVLLWVIDAAVPLPVTFCAPFLPREVPIIAVANKRDALKKSFLSADFEESVRDKMAPCSFCWVSARYNQGVDPLLAEIAQRLPIQPFFYAEDTLTDRTARFLVSEIIREKVFRCLGDELPYATAVHIESFCEKDNRTVISAIIYVEKTGHRKIVIGHQGHLIKTIGVAARQDIERLLECPVFLDLWVKVKPAWSDDLSCLRSWGYVEPDDLCQPDES